MKRFTMLILMVALTASIAGVAAAQTCPDPSGRRPLRQELRLREGARDGQLMRRHAYRMRTHQRQFRRMALRARAGQRIAMREHLRAHRLLERQHVRARQFRCEGRSI